MLKSQVVFCLLMGIGILAQRNDKQLMRDTLLLGMVRVRNSPCDGQTPGRVSLEGVCQSRVECSSLGGTSAGSCGVLGTCCTVERSCSNATSLKTSYFVGPQDINTVCNFRIDLANKDVCQIRLDFEEFVLAQPALLDEQPDCQDDRFTVISPNNLGFESLCGVNTGQHIYVRVNQTQGVNSVMLNFHLANRNGDNQQLPDPKWRIKITQLECSMSTFTGQSIAANDMKKLAPPGCLQYYPEMSGSYRSFNFVNERGQYLPNLNYAICFHRTADICGIRHTATYFKLVSNSDDRNFTNEACTTKKTCEPGCIVNEDFLYIPDGKTATLEATKFCGSALSSLVDVVSYAPGPLFVFFRSGKIRELQKQDGFSIDYTLLTC